MSDQDLFNNDTTDNVQNKEPPNTEQQNQSTDVNQMLGMIVNAEGTQKYASVEDALKGSVHAQAHIVKLEQELAQNKIDQDKSTKLDDVINAFQSKDSNNQEESGESNINPTDIQDIVQSAMTDINTKAAQSANITTVTGRFKELYGDKASETLYGKAEDLGMSQEDINSLIAKNPNAALKLLGIDKEAKPVPNTDNSSVNTDNFQHKEVDQPTSSMGYVSSKELTSNWLATKKRTLDQLGLT